MFVRWKVLSNHCSENTNSDIYGGDNYENNTSDLLFWGKFFLISEPQSLALNIDGKTDKCSRSEDVNFQFTGFGVVGKVGQVNTGCNQIL